MKKQKNLQSKSLIFAAAIAGAVLTLLFFFQPADRFFAALQPPLLTEKQKMTAAACPTFYYLLDELKEMGFKTIKVNSTAESLYYLQGGGADLVISGRMLKPEEPRFSFEVIGPGYSFLAKKEIAVLEEEMAEHQFFTDLAPEDIINQFTYILEDRITKTNKIYDYLSEGIIITSVENTDYSISEIVHVFRGDGSRHRFSRTPIIYYSDPEVLKYTPWTKN